jgi:site-specific DNA recombinase
MNKVCIYLRKSRADIEAEARGEMETLSKHRRTLMEIAKARNYSVVKIREELITAENIADRPEMKALLKEIKSSMYDGVMVMDIDRLCRGKLQDQGEILDAFKDSGTKIITPMKTYDLNNEWDEEYSEFEAFMARKELKLITRRMQRGRIRAVNDGKYIGTYPPFGYKFEYINNERVLVPHPDQVPVVKMIFEMYVNGLGGHKIAYKLNELGYKSATGIEWKMASIMSCVKNPVYCGILRWDTKEGRIYRKGKHEPLIPEELFKKAQDILQRKTHVPYNLKIANPLAGLVICAYCRGRMIQRPYKTVDDHIMCIQCNQNKSSKTKYIEEKIINELRNMLSENINRNKRTAKTSDTLNGLKKQLSVLQNELSEIHKQKNSLHDFLEKGIYSIETFLGRETILNKKITETKCNIDNTKASIETEEKRLHSKGNVIPLLPNALKMYAATTDPLKKNSILKEFVTYVEYKKEKHQRNDEFTIIVHTIDNP